MKRPASSGRGVADALLLELQEFVSTFGGTPPRSSELGLKLYRHCRLSHPDARIVELKNGHSSVHKSTIASVRKITTILKKPAASWGKLDQAQRTFATQQRARRGAESAAMALRTGPPSHRPVPPTSTVPAVDTQPGSASFKYADEPTVQFIYQSLVDWAFFAQRHHIEWYPGASQNPLVPSLPLLPILPLINIVCLC